MTFVVLIMSVIIIIHYIKLLASSHKLLFYSKYDKTRYFIKTCDNIKDKLNNNNGLVLVIFTILIGAWLLFFTIYFILSSIIVSTFWFTIISIILIINKWYSVITVLSWVNHYNKIKFNGGILLDIAEYVIQILYCCITVFTIYKLY